MRKPVNRPPWEFVKGCSVIVKRMPRGFEFTKREIRTFRRLIDNKIEMKFDYFFELGDRKMGVVYIQNNRMPWWFDADSLVRVK